MIPDQLKNRFLQARDVFKDVQTGYLKGEVSIAEFIEAERAYRAATTAFAEAVGSPLRS